ncbi:hypothetical protein QD357_30330 [Rhizobium sp. BR 317]|uniref:hypothetical protein n=1 Tax=Rhizobium sp. BR 317 TaxID=3040015 RepID=UPI0039BF713E
MAVDGIFMSSFLLLLLKTAPFIWHPARLAQRMKTAPPAGRRRCLRRSQLVKKLDERLIANGTTHSPILERRLRQPMVAHLHTAAGGKSSGILKELFGC